MCIGFLKRNDSSEYGEVNSKERTPELFYNSIWNELKKALVSQPAYEQATGVVPAELLHNMSSTRVLL